MTPRLRFRRRLSHKPLRSADFFDADHHPEVRFRSTGVTDLGDGRPQVEGELEAAGERVPLELQATVAHTDDTHIELDAAATVDQRRLGMTWSPLGMAKTPTALTVHARLRRALIMRVYAAPTLSMPSGAPSARGGRPRTPGTTGDGRGASTAIQGPAPSGGHAQPRFSHQALVVWC